MKNLKNLFNTSRILLLVGFAMLAGLTACDTTGLTEAADDFKVIIGLDPINSGATVVLYDAATDELINETVSVTLGGQNGDDVIDIYSDPLTAVDVEDGILNLGINNNVVPTEDNPAKITLEMSAPDYISTTKTVTLFEEGFEEYTLSMVAENNKPEGIDTQTSETTTNDDGTLAEDFVIDSNPDGTNDEATRVTIPAGATLTDDDGNVLTGNIKAEITSYDPGDPTAMANIPVNVEDVATSEDEVPQILGYSDIEIIGSSNKRASKITIKSKSATEYSTTVVLSEKSRREVGDVVKVFVNGLFKNRAEKEVIKLSDNKIGVQVTHDELINYVFVYSSLGDAVNVEFDYDKVDITPNGYSGGDLRGIANSYGLSLTFKATLAEEPQEVKSTLNKNEIWISGDPSNIHITDPVDVVLYDNEAFPEKDDLPINLPQAPANLIDATINVNLECPTVGQTVNVTTIPQASVLYRKNNTEGKWRVVTDIEWVFNDDENYLESGSFDVNGVEGGENYTFKLSYDGNTETKLLNNMQAANTIKITDEIDSICE